MYALMTFAMLLGSMNYNNNLSFLLTFMLVGVGFVAMHQCQRNLVGLELSFAGTEPVFAGQSLRFRIAVANRSKSPRHRVRLYGDDSQSEIEDLEPGGSKVFALPVMAERRGWVTLERFGIRTLFPFELFRSWAWLHMNPKGIVYPHPADDAPPPPATQSALGHRQHDARGEEDFAGLRKFHTGDSPRNVAWKAYARSDQLLSKQYAGADMSSQWFDFDALPAEDTERRLSILTRWIVDAEGNVYVSDALNHRIQKFGTAVIEVAFVVKPGDVPATIHPRSKGVFPVAILTTRTDQGDEQDFDAGEVDPWSLRCGPGEASIVHATGHFEDVDGDGVVTGYGTVNGRVVFVFSQDFTVFGGRRGQDVARRRRGRPERRRSWSSSPCPWPTCPISKTGSRRSEPGTTSCFMPTSKRATARQP